MDQTYVHAAKEVTVTNPIHNLSDKVSLTLTTVRGQSPISREAAGTVASTNTWLTPTTPTGVTDTGDVTFESPKA